MTGTQKLYLLVPLAPLAGAILAGFFGRRIGRAGAHWATILGVAVSFLASCYVAADVFSSGTRFDGPLYTWASSGGIDFQVGFLIDRLTVLMMIVVTFVSLMVHVYSIGYMAEDDGYQRFFAYISLFTFSMLMLVMSNNFLQLFFGWEAVGLVSYLLIGFWYKRPTAIYANLKAFLVNRVGDFGFVLGIGLIAAYFGSMHYATVFGMAPRMAEETVTLLGGTPWMLMTVICICLFIGAMGKSAQFPLHVWLPDSMEGPTPISALIHAATMVTAGIFMVARMSPLFELSEAALSFVMIIGAITAFFMALVAVVVYDIKRVVAYSTLSQLGYMTVALGASAYPAAIFHLYTHAFFKAALFLAAGSVIIAMHHEQDMRRMGGLRRYLPVTYAVMLIGGLANAALPPFAGFFSKETIIEAARVSTTPGHWFAYACVLASAYVTALYTFRLIFYAFHGKARFDVGGPAHDTHGAVARATDAHDDRGHHGGVPRESPWVVTVPLVLLAIPSVVAGYVIGRVVFGDYFGDAIYIAPEHTAVARLADGYHGVFGMITHAFFTLPFWLVVAGIATAWYLYIVRPELPGALRARFSGVVRILENKYGLDDFNQRVFGDGAIGFGRLLWKAGDQALIDGVAVNGSARLVVWIARVVRQAQTGLVNTYAFAMIGTVAAAIGLAYWFMIRPIFQN